MRVLGQLSLLASFVAAGYAAAAYTAGGLVDRRLLRRTADVASMIGFISLTITLGVLIHALALKDFSFSYVAQYSSQLLPSHYSVSALWVGQAGSLLLWAWITGVFAILLRCVPTFDDNRRQVAVGIVLAFVCFLLGIMVFAADPMKASLTVPRDGRGLSPLLQHPSMLIHPPVVFVGYALWTMPFALALAALLTGRLSTSWTQEARPWALGAWAVLGTGILLGARWAYQELGWGGYWGWDPVENGSLLPWLTGTAFIHGLMAWRHRGCFKKLTVSLGITTFGLCNFATFLTRSGIFSSVHAFSESPIGWMFLGLMIVLVLMGVALTFRCRSSLVAQQQLTSIFARESFILISITLLCVFSAVVIVGTLVSPLSPMIVGRTVQFGPEFYNRVFMPVGLVLLALTAAVPLLRWGSAPSRKQVRAITICGSVGLFVGTALFASGQQNITVLLVAIFSATTLSTFVAAILLDMARLSSPSWIALLKSFRQHRRQYAGYVTHLALLCVAIGVTGSSLGTRRKEMILNEGQRLRWADREIHYVKLSQREAPDKLIAEIELQLTDSQGRTTKLFPARHLHVLQNEWTSEVAIHSTWRGDFYAILSAGLGEGRVSVTLIDNPLMRWIWFGGGLAVAAVIVAAWPESRKQLRVVTETSDRRNHPSSVTKRRKVG